MSVTLNYCGKIYIIDKEPFETNQDTYNRGWFIIKNNDKYSNYNELVSMSIINNNLKKQMEYHSVM